MFQIDFAWGLLEIRAWMALDVDLVVGLGVGHVVHEDQQEPITNGGCLKYLDWRWFGHNHFYLNT